MGHHVTAAGLQFRVPTRGIRRGTSTALTDAHQGSAGRDWSGPAAKRIVTGYGFWIFILSDMIMFSAFFATYAVLLGQTAGGPSGRELFDLKNVAIETGFLLASSFTCGLASIAPDTRSTIWFQLAMAVTCAFRLGFLPCDATQFPSPPPP